MSTPKRAAIYARVSTVGKGQDTAPQVEALQEFAARAGYEVVAEEVDHASGAKVKRPGREKLMELARKRKLDVLLVWKLDRLGRSFPDTVNHMQELEELDVALVVPGMLDFSTTMGKAMARLLAVLAEVERDFTRERVHLGLAHARAKGVKLGRKAGPDEKKFDRVIQLLAEGKSFRQAAKLAKVSLRTVTRYVGRWREKHGGDLASAAAEVGAKAATRILEEWRKHREGGRVDG